jgi:hypothetical protein
MSGFSEVPFLGRPGDRAGAGLDLLSAACCAFVDFLLTTARLDFFAFGTWNPGNLGYANPLRRLFGFGMAVGHEH